MSRTVALVPIRSLSGGKTRLAGMFDPDQRSAFVLRMAHRLLDVLVASRLADEIVVLTSDGGLRDVLHHEPVTLLSNVPPGLNVAIGYGRNHAIGRGADRLLVVFPDLPEVSVEDLQEIDRSPSPVTIVADRQHDGTNALLLQGFLTLDQFEFRYGPGSLRKHQVVAEHLGLAASMLTLTGMSTDLDTPADWNELAGQTRRWLLDPLSPVRAEGASILALEHS